MAERESSRTPTEPDAQGLRAVLADAHPLYLLPKDPVAEDVLVPALKATSSLDIMMGYFSSSSFSEIAQGLPTFLRNTRSPLRMVISPFLTTEDFDTLTKDEGALVELSQRILIDDVPDEDVLARYALECLAWLITQSRLILKIAVIRGGLFHPKVWLLSDAEHRVALHGSTNLTRAGLRQNREQLSLSRDWKGEEAVFHIDRLSREFAELWSGGDNDCHVLPLPDAVSREVVVRYKSSELPTETALQKLWRRAHGGGSHGGWAGPSRIPELSIPAHLSYESGDFAHQGTAVKAWEHSECRGILELATGAGKTITALICATRLQQRLGRLLVVVSAPYRPLIAQWCDAIRNFGVEPVNLSAAGGPRARNREIRKAARRLRMRSSRAEVLVVSNNTLCTETFVRSLPAEEVPLLLIGDECHNLGAVSFATDPPHCFEYRLGLSATPIRQYDEPGTEGLLKYFGDVCFSYTLEEAIGSCLVEYDYHVHFVDLSEEEMQEWRVLTERIAGQAWRWHEGSSDPYMENLLRQRRLVLESASGKLHTLATLVDEEGPRHLRHTLVYATDKNPEQLVMVNRLLAQRGVLFHQLTQEETRDRQRSGEILSAFQEGALQVLTAKRVLDEGVDIPQTQHAYILASTTVRRQWVQRRGRLLRKCSAVGKTHAVIHDFIVLPPDSRSSTNSTLDRDARRLVRSELARVWEFARLSRNGPTPGGPYEAVQLLQELSNERVMD